jgi:hypothetical protein
MSQSPEMSWCGTLNHMDLKNPKLMYLKGGLFVVTGLLASAAILQIAPSWRVAALLAIAIWSFSRAYYFAFYVIEHYIDARFRFAGLSSFLQYILRRR